MIWAFLFYSLLACYLLAFTLLNPVKIQKIVAHSLNRLIYFTYTLPADETQQPTIPASSVYVADCTVWAGPDPEGYQTCLSPQ
jgi:hypothetical protein